MFLENSNGMIISHRIIVTLSLSRPLSARLRNIRFKKNKIQNISRTKYWF